MVSVSTKIFFQILIGGLFVLVAFAALNIEHASIGFYNILALLLVFLLAFALSVSNRYHKHFKKMLHSAENLSKGDWENKIRLQSRDELGQLAKAFNKIANDLWQSKLETEKLGKVFDAKVHKITALMGETISALEKKIKNRTMEFHSVLADYEALEKEAKAKDVQISALQKKVSKLELKKPKKRARAS